MRQCNLSKEICHCGDFWKCRRIALVFSTERYVFRTIDRRLFRRKNKKNLALFSRAIDTNQWQLKYPLRFTFISFTHSTSILWHLLLFKYLLLLHIAIAWIFQFVSMFLLLSFLIFYEPCAKRSVTLSWIFDFLMCLISMQNVFSLWNHIIWALVLIQFFLFSACMAIL